MKSFCSYFRQKKSEWSRGSVMISRCVFNVKWINYQRLWRIVAPLLTLCTLRFLNCRLCSNVRVSTLLLKHGLFHFLLMPGPSLLSHSLVIIKSLYCYLSPSSIIPDFYKIHSTCIIDAKHKNGEKPHCFF
jgi:hypothetical protein